jgi:NAD kinase
MFRQQEITGGAESLAVPKVSPPAPSPTLAQSPAISRDEILVVTKMSRFEREKAATNLSEEQLLTHYKSIGECGSRILAAYLHHQDSVELCKRELSPEHVVSLDALDTVTDLSRYKLVVALGGDDFFKLVGHHIQDKLPILGVNSDPASSVGALLPITIEQLPDALARIERGEYHLEPWTRLQVTLNGGDQGAAINDIILGKRDFRLTSRHQLEFRGEKVMQRCSGILISTGVGSTGWYASAGLYLGDHDRSFPKTARFARFELREPSATFTVTDRVRKAHLPPLVEGTIEEGETLRITSLNDDEGIVSRDSLDQRPFPRGTVAEISIHPKPLIVLIPGGAPC